MKEYEPKLGDLIEVEWADHHRYKGERPIEPTVKSWGKVEEVIKNGRAHDGIAIVQNEWQNPPEGIDRVMDGQYILSSAIVSIKKL